jgi:CubicO group peptidase (beta-lactamase class C family)
VVACSGVFAKDSTHLKLATKYDSRNVVFGQVDGPDGTKIPASILFPNDPRKRLEILWSNEASRSDTQVIAINGKSQWIAPKGLKLRLAIPTLEKINGKPFKLSSFGADGSASVLGWEGGAMSTLPGGCKVGLRLFEDGKTPQDARDAVAGDKELLSSDASVRAVKPSVGEILIGY